MVDETEADHEEPQFEWAVVEIFGHRKHAGRAREEERFGAKMLRIDVPTVIVQDGALVVTGWTTSFYGGASIFSFGLTTEKTVLQANRPYDAPARISYDDPDDIEEYP